MLVRKSGNYEFVREVSLSILAGIYIILNYFFLFSVQEIVYAMKGILDVDVTNALQVTEDIHIVSRVLAVEQVALILTHARVIVRVR